MRALHLDLDDRRELYRLFERLSPPDRVRFLQWACRQVRGKGHVHVKAGHSGTASECLGDLAYLEVIYGLDTHALACRLERFVRTGK